MQTAADTKMPLQIPPETDSQGRKIWTVGTLVYTTSGLVLLFVWLLWGDFALSMRDRSVGPLIEKFLLLNGAGNTLKQVLTGTLPTAISLILAPAVSYKSDRLRGRWGRRIPFLIIPTPIAGLAMVGIAFCPQMGEALFYALGNTLPAGADIKLAASNYTLSIFTVFWTIFEVAVIISGAVFGGLINDVVPRPVLGRFHGLFRAISLYDGILFNALLFPFAASHFTLLFALIGILFGGGFTLMCLKVREGNYPPPPVEDPDVALQASGGGIVGLSFRILRPAATYLKECFSQPYYLLCFGMLMFAALTFRPINDFTIRYAAQLGMEDGDYGFLVASSYLISLILAFPLGMFVDRFHPIRMSLVALMLYLITAAYGSLFIHSAATFGIALVAHTVISGTYFTCAASLAQQLFPRAKFSQYASAGAIVASLSLLIYAPTMGFILDVFKYKGIGKEGKEVDFYHYEMTFWAGLILAAATMITLLMVYRRFNRYGGVNGYLAPGDDPETAPSRLEPPAHMAQILFTYFAGAAIGVAVGYVIAYLVQPAAVARAGVTLSTFHELLMSDKQEDKFVRNITSFCVATGVIPFTVLGAWIGSAMAKRKKAALDVVPRRD